MAAKHRYLSLSTLSRRPVLIAMMVYAVAYGAASFAVWREATATSDYRKCEKHYLVQNSSGNVGQSETVALRKYDTTRAAVLI